MGDAEYYLPTKKEAQTIINRSIATRKKYSEGFYDCDDFAFVLKSHFCQAAYRRGAELGTSYCMGIISGEGLWTSEHASQHAMNWVITHNGFLWLVEP